MSPFRPGAPIKNFTTLSRMILTVAVVNCAIIVSVGKRSLNTRTNDDIITD